MLNAFFLYYLLINCTPQFDKGYNYPCSIQVLSKIDSCLSLRSYGAESA